MNPELSVVIPAYNEEQRLPASLSQVKAYLDGRAVPYEVIVVDDGSQDRTLTLVREFQAGFPQMKILANGRNRGKGFSVRRGFLEATAPLVLFTDADMSAPIEEMEKLHAAMPQGDGAIGSRAMADSDVFRHQAAFRELSGKCFNLLVHLFTGLRFRDTQCGFKLFRREPFLPVFRSLTLDGFAFDVEILYLARKAGLAVSEVPVRWGHAEGSRVRFFPDALLMFAELLKIQRRHRGGNVE